MISQHLITSALELTGRPHSTISTSTDGIEWEFSMEKFFAYIQDHEFIEKYRNMKNVYNFSAEIYIQDFRIGIDEYRDGNEKYLIELLDKIGTNNDK